jgi:uncharacterized phage protein (TIGR02218 family)
MKTATPQLIALLNGNAPFFKADFFTLTLADGTVLRTTSADRILTFGANTFLPAAPIMNRTRSRTVIGVEVDTIDVTIFPKIENAQFGVVGDTLQGLPWIAATRQGALDGAFLLIETAYLAEWPTVVGTLVTSYGRVGVADTDRTSVSLQVKSALELLNTQMPRNLYQSVCLNTLYDTACAAVKVSFTVTGSVSGSSTISGFSTALGQASGYFEQGVLTFTSGANNGLKRTVKSFAGGAFTFAFPWPVAPGVGDTFSVFAGCDKTKATCNSKFSNLGRFRGFPEIPVPETVF